MSDAPLVFFDDDTAKPDDTGRGTWKILVVDDDRDVHSVTEFVMHGVSILNKSLSFLHAYSAAEARDILRRDPEIAVILLDVVMESEDAGLTLVKTVRDELGYQATRIILRTGQPGYAPEYEAIRDYDINDYRTKSELSYARLLTSLTAAIRSYVQIKTIAENGRGLEFIIQSAPDLLSRSSIDSFAPELIRQLQGLVGLDFSAKLINFPAPDENESPMVIHATGAFTDSAAMPWGLNGASQSTIDDRVNACLNTRENQFGPDWACLYFQGTMERKLCLYAEFEQTVSDPQRKLIEVFTVAAVMGYQNMLLVNQLRMLAFQDNITGLLNRTGFIGAIDQATMAGKRDKTVAIIDIEGFSEINEALGHDFGDDILKAVAQRLMEHFGTGAALGRVSADGFSILDDEHGLTPEVVAEIFSKPFAVKQQSMYLRVVSGFVKLAEVQGDGADMIKDAFIAVKIAKFQQQARFHYYNHQLEEETRKKLALLDQLQSALANNGLQVHYQPQVDMRTGKLTGVEALLRWKRESGFVAPDVFIPLAEQSGLIVEVGDWVLNEVCRQIVEWNKAGIKGLRVAVNISVRQFNNPGFLTSLDATLKRYGVPHSQLELEITESMAMHDVKAILSLLTSIKKLGFFIAIDDFGTGFSSLSYLQQLPIDRLKIDRSFILSIHQADRNKAIAGLIVGLGKSLGLSVIAEGVEDPAQSAILMQMGCVEAQGYLFGKPLDSASTTRWLIENYKQ